MNFYLVIFWKNHSVSIIILLFNGFHFNYCLTQKKARVGHHSLNLKLNRRKDLQDFALSANLGYLFTEYDLIDAIARSSEAGFRAVECQRPYNTSPSGLRRACERAGMQVCQL